MPGPFVHQLDPVLADAGGIYLWWYGLSYTLGFLQIHLFLMRERARLALSVGEVYALSLYMIVGVLAGGRLIQVAFDEWPFYRAHLALMPAYWLGGMATHGLLLGAGVSAAAFAQRHRRRFLPLADALVIPGAFLMGMGRIGNFIDGQIVGSLTQVWWGVQFPDAEGFRHPVVLYDGAKNLLLVPYLQWVRITNPTPGAVAARFVFWYAFLRIFIDLFRDYPTHRFALGTGQTLNIVMTLLGALLLYRSRLRRLGRLPGSAKDDDAVDRAMTAASRVAADAASTDAPPRLLGRRVALIALLLFCLVIPSNWTQDIPVRYGKRHPGLTHSVLYPRIDRTPSHIGTPPTSIPVQP